MWQIKKFLKKDIIFDLTLTKTKDILKYLSAYKREGQFIAGVALETENETKNATKKLIEKNVDCIILNSLNYKGAVF
ncbi:MAG: phosphopantothenoylcysteine decarboxylase [Bacteroidota bacterium]